MNELFVLHKDGELLVTSIGRGFRSRNRHWVFRSFVQAELHAKRHKADIVKYVPVAQMEERFSPKEDVGSSNLSGDAK